MRKNTRIRHIICKGYGHWKIVVEQEHWRRKYPFGLSSITTWTYITTDSVSIDAYRSDDDSKVKDGENCLIYQAKTWGVKEIEKYR